MDNTDFKLLALAGAMMGSWHCLLQDSFRLNSAATLETTGYDHRSTLFRDNTELVSQKSTAIKCKSCIIFEPTPWWKGLLPRVQNSRHFDHTCGRCFTKEIEMLFWCLNQPTEIKVAVTFVVNISYQTIKQERTCFKRSRRSKKGLEISSILQKLKRRIPVHRKLHFTNSFTGLFKCETYTFVYANCCITTFMFLQM